MMRKILLSLSVASFCALAANAQTRLSLYEEFSGENCGPCAASNPGLNTLLAAGTNGNKVLLIKYQSPIPSAGPIYNLYKTQTDTRLAYYSVPFAPYGRLNGTGLGTGTAAPTSPGHIANLIQADIDNAYATPSAFNITATHAWIAGGDSVTADINIAAVSAFAPSGANMKLRVALIETLEYCNAPGTNGEKVFHHVVREMYPDAGGTSISNSWTMGQTQTLTIKGRAPKWVDKSNTDAILVVWIQNDNDKAIAQAAKSTKVALGVDGGFTGCPNAILDCATASKSIASSVTLKNTGTSPLTSATIYYKVDAAGTYSSYSWNGSLAAGATTTISLPAINVTTGSHAIIDSLGNTNGSAEINKGNNISQTNVTIINTNAAALPISTGFENAGAVPPNWTLYDKNGDGQNFVVASSSSSNVGHNNSKYLLYYPCYAFADGEVNYAILPAGNLPNGAKSLDFWVAHAQYNASSNDKLEVVYTTDCGANWTSVWSRAGAALATVGATTSNYVPAQADWKLKSVDITSVPTGAQVALRGTSNYGNNIFIDDVNLRAGAVVGVPTIIANNSVSIYPNPAVATANLAFSLTEDSKVQVLVYDAMGRLVATVANTSMQKGQHTVAINTAAFASGLYNVKIQTEQGAQTERLTVVK